MMMIAPNTTIGFIGAGNMASALLAGLLAKGIAPAQLWVANPSAAKLTAFAAQGVNTTSDNLAVVAHCQTIVLAVKPQKIATVVQALQTSLTTKPCLLISIAAGISCHGLLSWTQPSQAIVRCMPNTPALVGAGACGMFANANVNADQKLAAQAIMQAVGSVCWLEREQQLDAVTALSGSGPAYFFLLIQAMQAAGIKLGLPAEVARQLSLQTAFGAAKLALYSDMDVIELRRRVSSPGGTTEAAIKQFESEDFHNMVERALTQAALRAQELRKIELT
jgi:pyrroline-5-carboxylate reductase